MSTTLVSPLTPLVAVQLNGAFGLVVHLYVMAFWPSLMLILYRYSVILGSVPCVTSQVMVLLVQFQLITGFETLSEKKNPIHMSQLSDYDMINRHTFL